MFCVNGLGLKFYVNVNAILKHIYTPCKCKCKTITFYKILHVHVK